MKIKMLRSSVCDRKDVYKDQIVDASEKDAKFLISIGKAEVAEDEKPNKTKKTKETKESK